MPRIRNSLRLGISYTPVSSPFSYFSLPLFLSFLFFSLLLYLIHSNFSSFPPVPLPSSSFSSFSLPLFFLFRLSFFLSSFSAFPSIFPSSLILTNSPSSYPFPLWFSLNFSFILLSFLFSSIFFSSLLYSPLFLCFSLILSNFSPIFPTLSLWFISVLHFPHFSFSPFLFDLLQFSVFLSLSLSLSLCLSSRLSACLQFSIFFTSQEKPGFVPRMSLLSTGRYLSVC